MKTSTKLVLAAAALLLLISLAANLVLAVKAYQLYGRERIARLDPSNERRFRPANAALPPCPPDSVRIVFAGDSSFAMWSPLPELKKVQVINQGHGGDTTAQLLLRLERDVLALRPQVVVVEIGINDLLDIGVLPEEEEAILETTTRNIRALVGRLLEAGIQVCLLTILPFGDVEILRRPVWFDGTYRAAEEVNAMIRTLAAPGVTVIDCDPVLASQGRRRSAYSKDVAHLNASGYQALNEAVQPVLQELVRSSQVATRK